MNIWNKLRFYADPIMRGLTLATAALVLILLVKVNQLGEENKDKLDKITNSYAPLTFDQTQNVVREPPVFHLGEAVSVEADFKNSDSVPVSFTGAVHWRLVSPDERVEVLQFEFNGTVPPGCKQFRFENLPPGQVVEVTKRLFQQGYGSVTWELYGDNVIVSPRAGNTIAFHVEQFRYIPDNQPLPKTQDIHANTQCENL